MEQSLTNVGSPPPHDLVTVHGLVVGKQQQNQEQQQVIKVIKKELDECNIGGGYNTTRLV